GWVTLAEKQLRGVLRAVRDRGIVPSGARHIEPEHASADKWIVVAVHIGSVQVSFSEERSVSLGVHSRFIREFALIENVEVRLILRFPDDLRVQPALAQALVIIDDDLFVVRVAVRLIEMIAE